MPTAPPLPPKIDIESVPFRNTLTELINNTALNTCTQILFTIAALSGSDRTVTVQMRNNKGENLAFVQTGLGYISSDATGATPATADGLSGVDEIITNQSFMFVTGTDGSIDITVTGSANRYLCIQLPNGHVVVSDVLTFT